MTGTKQNISETKVIAAAHDNQDVLELMQDSFQSVRKALRLEGMLFGTRVYGNQIDSIIAKANPDDTIKAIEMEYDMTTWCIHEINNLVGGNIVDMSGSNSAICKRFYNKYRRVI